LFENPIYIKQFKNNEQFKFAISKRKKEKIRKKWNQMEYQMINIKWNECSSTGFAIGPTVWKTQTKKNKSQMQKTNG